MPRRPGVIHARFATTQHHFQTKSRLFVSTPLRPPSTPHRAPSAPHMVHFISVSDAIDAMTQVTITAAHGVPQQQANGLFNRKRIFKIETVGAGTNMPRCECAHKINEQHHTTINNIRRPSCGGRIVALANKTSMPSILRRRRPLPVCQRRAREMK